MAYVYYTDDGSIQGFSRERSDIPLGTHCTAISREDWILWIPVVLNHRYIDGEFIPLVREPTPFEEWVRASTKDIKRRPENKKK